MLVSKKMRFLIPQLIWTGISISVYTGILIPIIYDTISEDFSENDKFKMSMLAMMTLGIGEILGGIGMGVLVDKIGTRKSVWVNVLNIVITTVVTAIYIKTNVYGFMAFVMAFFWGLSDSCVSIHLDAILGFEFTSNKEPFSIDCLIESTTVVTF